MTIDEAMEYAKRRTEHYRVMKAEFSDTPDEEAYYQRNADMLEALCDEVTRLRKELLVAVGRE